MVVILEMKQICPNCKQSYAEFRTGYTYRDIFEMRWKPADPQSAWLYKRKRSILGMWHQLKKEMWLEHLANCKNLSYTINYGDFKEY